MASLIIPGKINNIPASMVRPLCHSAAKGDWPFCSVIASLPNSALLSSLIKTLPNIMLAISQINSHQPM